jgi:hypothetical protein
MPWTTGKENFPSERSSAKPLFDVYYVYKTMRHSDQGGVENAYLGALQVHEIITNLEKHAD